MRPKLTPEQLAQREAEKAALKANKRPYNKKTITPMETGETNQNNANSNVSSSEVDNNKNASTETTASTVDNNPEHNSSGSGSSASEQQLKTGYRAFTGKVKHRDYSTPQIDETLRNTVIPESNFGPSQNQQTANVKDLLNKKPNETPLTQKIGDTTGFNQLEGKEKAEASGMAADLVFEGYDLLHFGGRQLLKINEEKLKERQRKNEVNLAIVIEVDDQGNQNTLLDFVQQINSDIDKEIVVTDDFKNKVRAPLERVLAKSGLGVSDGMYVAGMFAKDAVQKAAIGIGIRKSCLSVIEQFADHHQQSMAALHTANAKIEAQAAELAALKKEKQSAPVAETMASKEEKTELAA